jgi:hypothetical protein
MNDKFTNDNTTSTVVSHREASTHREKEEINAAFRKMTAFPGF